MDRLPAWGNASAVVLSCPGPLRRHTAALIPVAELSLPQVLLGAESQLLAFAAAATGFGARMFFAPLPEMFPDAGAVRAAWRRLGGQDAEGQEAGGQRGRLVHLRFGGARSARVLKGVRNGCVLAEQGAAAPLTASHHPFASGAVLPAAVQRVFGYGQDMPRLQTVLGAPIPASRLPAACLAADLACFQAGAVGADDAGQGLDIVSLAEFRSFAWAAGPVRGRGRPGEAAGDRRPSLVLVPWNMDHPGSIVPHLLERLARLYASAPPAGQKPMPQLVLLPFNYVGQTGIIRRLIGRLRDAAHEPAAFLSAIHLARTGSLGGVASLARVSRCAWVDGNDPEHWWTLARLSACGIAPVLIDPGAHPAHDVARVVADEAIWVEAETRCGTLTFPARLPSFRALPGLLAQSPRTRRQGGRLSRKTEARGIDREAALAAPA